MARRKKSEPHVETPPEASDEIEREEAGDGELTDEQRQVLALQYKKKLTAAEAKKDAAVAEIRNIRKQIKVELGAGAVETVKAMMALETEDGEARIHAQIERAITAARWMGVPLGMQGELFADRTPAVDQVRAAGKAARIKGEPCKAPHSPSVPQHDAWIEGWHDGTRVMNEAQKRDDALAFDAPPIGEKAATFTETAATH